jgi:hypothetical protein
MRLPALYSLGLCSLASARSVTAFVATPRAIRRPAGILPVVLAAVAPEQPDDASSSSSQSAPPQQPPNDVAEEFQGASFAKASVQDANDDENDGQPAVAATRTVNERLLAELQAAADQEKSGSRSTLTKKYGLDKFQSTKTDEEREAAIAEARNLNGVNPLVTGVAAVVALAAAYGLWITTTAVGVYLATHPVDSDWYVVQRSATVFRNVAVGLVSLAAGFCGVTGLGLALLTGQVAAGIAQGTLDPTPIAPTQAQKDGMVELPKMWDLMLNKKPTRRSGGKDLFSD